MSGDHNMNQRFPNSNVYYSDTVSRTIDVTDIVTRAIEQERKRIVNLFMIQHEAAKGAHNYWQVAANLIQADVASDT